MGGSKIAGIRRLTGAKITIADGPKNGNTRVAIRGNEGAKTMALQHIKELLE